MFVQIIIMMNVFAIAHVDDVKPLFGPVTYQAISIGLIILLIIGIIVVVGGVAIVKSKDKNRKRFF